MVYTCLRWSASARAHLHTPLPYHANGWADCVQTWYVANDPLDERLTQVRCGVHLHVRTCTPPSNDGASSPARPSPIKASYWLLGYLHCSHKYFTLIFHVDQDSVTQDYARPKAPCDKIKVQCALYETLQVFLNKYFAFTSTYYSFVIHIPVLKIHENKIKRQ